MSKEEPPPYKPTDPNNKFWNDQLAKLRLTSLGDVQKAAGSWATSLGSLVGIFSIAGFIKGRTDLSELAEWARYGVAIIGGVALLVAAYAIWKAAIAAQGLPRRIPIGGAEAEKTYGNLVEDAIGNLQASRYAGILTVLLIAVATGLLWFGPPADKADASPSYLLQSRSGSVLCGKLITSPVTGAVSLQPQPKPQSTASVAQGVDTSAPMPTATLAPTVGLTDVVSITTVPSCP